MLHAQSAPLPKGSRISATASIDASLVLPESRVFTTRTNTGVIQMLPRRR